MITHHTTSPDGVERAWAVDDRAAAQVAPWIQRAPQVFAADLEGMATYFPHWVLAGAKGGVPLQCSRCAAFVVPTAGALRCIVCGAAAQAERLLWVGHIPAMARAEPAFEHRRRALHSAGFSEASNGGLSYVFVPLTVLYPTEWPNVEPVVRYSGRWLDALGLPRASAQHHLIGKSQACIFAWGQWRTTPIHAVLQQRVINHIASLLKIAAGQSPAQAFIGKIHHDDWQPER